MGHHTVILARRRGDAGVLSVLNPLRGYTIRLVRERSLFAHIRECTSRRSEHELAVPHFRGGRWIDVLVGAHFRSGMSFNALSGRVDAPEVMRLADARGEYEIGSVGRINLAKMLAVTY